LTNNYEILAIIPARGGSKGVPKKNIRQLGGKPLIAWTVTAALNTPCLNRVVVSTDDREIAAIAKEYGAEVPFLRPEKWAQDDTSDLPVYQHALQWLEENERYRPDIVVWLRPTSPLRTSDDIAGAVRLFVDTRPEWVRSVCEAEHHPYWMYRLDDLTMQPFVNGVNIAEYYRRQHLPPVYRINGSVDVTWADQIQDRGNLYHGFMKAYIMPSARSIDVDTELDFVLLESVLKMEKK